MFFHSIRFRMIILFVAFVVVILFFSGWILLWSIRQSLESVTLSRHTALFLNPVQRRQHPLRRGGDGVVNPGDAVDGGHALQAVFDALEGANSLHHRRRFITFEEMMDSTEKAIIEETVIYFNNQELAYELALNAAAKIIQPTLMDFLR